MRNKDTAVIYDRDSVLCLTSHRWHLSPNAKDPVPRASWDVYSLACKDDPPNRGLVARMALDWEHHQVHVVTCGSDAATEEILDWHREHAPYYDYLTMRPAGDRTPNPEFKVAYIRRLQERGVLVVLAYEDLPETKRAIEQQTGVPVVGVNPMYKEDDDLRSMPGH